MGNFWEKKDGQNNLSPPDLYPREDCKDGDVRLVDTKPWEESVQSQQYVAPAPNLDPRVCLQYSEKFSIGSFLEPYYWHDSFETFLAEEIFFRSVC